MSKKKLQVFISSTYTDLIGERQAAVQAVLDAGHIPAGMELFKAGDKSQLDTIRKWIDNSDVYMLIMGGRYGTVEKESNKSYTQLEYEYAAKKGLPIFSFLLSNPFLENKAKILGKEKVYERENVTAYENFKELVLSKIVKWGDDEKDIKLTVHTTLKDFIEEYDLIGWVRSNDTEANHSLLTQLNELSINNKELLDENKRLLEKLSSLQTSFESNLAFEDEEIMIIGKYNVTTRNSEYGGISTKFYKLEKSIFWNELFLLWAPRLTATVNYIKAKSELEKALQDYMGRAFQINENLFHIIKIQFSAIGLINFFESRTTEGGLLEFISLTSKGKDYLIQNMAIKKSQP